MSQDENVDMVLESEASQKLVQVNCTPSEYVESSSSIFDTLFTLGQEALAQIQKLVSDGVEFTQEQWGKLPADYQQYLKSAALAFGSLGVAIMVLRALGIYPLQIIAGSIIHRIRYSGQDGAWQVSVLRQLLEKIASSEVFQQIPLGNLTISILVLLAEGFLDIILKSKL